MREIRKLLIEGLGIALWMAILVAAFSTDESAGVMGPDVGTIPLRINFTLWLLGGFFILTAGIVLVGMVITRLAGIFIRDDRASTVRLWILTFTMGTVILLVKPIFLVSIFDSLGLFSSFAANLIGLSLLIYFVSILLSMCVNWILEKLGDKAFWSVIWGGWLLLVTLPHFSKSISISLGLSTGYRSLIFLAALIIFGGIFWFLLPRLYTWLTSGNKFKPVIPFAVLILLYVITLPVSDKLPPGVPASADNPSVVFISVDTLRMDALEIYSEGKVPRMETPAITGIADEGAVFDYSFATSSWTLPSVASFMSGLPPSVHGATTLFSTITPDATTLAEILNENDYLTAAYIVNTILGADSGLDQGFDIYESIATLRKKILLLKMRGHLRIFTPRSMRHLPSDDEAADLAAEFINEHASERFFLWLHLFAPHQPYTPPREFKEYMREDLGVDFTSVDTKSTIDLQLGGNITQTRLESLVYLYSGEVARIDFNVAKVIDALEANGIKDDCIVVFTADHGDEFYDHDRFDHGYTLYPELTMVPLIISWPGVIPSGMRIDSTVSGVDLPPTLLDLAGVPAELDGDHALFTGKSFVPLMNGEPWEETPAFFEAPMRFDNSLQGIAYDGFYYIGGARTVCFPRMYWLEDDPWSMYNILREHEDMGAYMVELLTEYDEMCEGLNSGLEQGEERNIDDMLRSLGYIN